MDVKYCKVVTNAKRRACCSAITHSSFFVGQVWHAEEIPGVVSEEGNSVIEKLLLSTLS